MNQTTLYWEIALGMIPTIGPVHAKTLLEYFEPRELFNQTISTLETIHGIGHTRATAIASFSISKEMDKEIQRELAFIEKHQIETLFITDNNYPTRLLNCIDAPTILYKKGDAALNTNRMIAIVGTRLHTEYGKRITEELIQFLQPFQVTIVSGLAYGIDAIAHEAALKYNLPTIGVLAHGLDEIYPPKHYNLAKEMCKLNGALLTEFRTKSKATKYNFPSRNRIVAGMTDATIVIESKSKGGSLITAELAAGYEREVFAVPGRVSDTRSLGCNELIKDNKAIIYTGPETFTNWMGWTTVENRNPIQTLNTHSLSPLELSIYTQLQERERMQLDQIQEQTNVSHGQLAVAILNLELGHWIVSLPGNYYKVL